MYFDVLGVCAFDFQEIIDLKGERVASSQDRSELRGMHACRTCKNMTNSLGYNLSLELDPGEQHDTYAFHRMSALFGDPAEIKDQAAEQVPLPAQPFSPRGVANLIYFGLSTTQFVEIGKFFDLVWPSPYR